MKKLYLSMILCFCTLLGATAQAEATDTLNVTDSKDFKKWSEVTDTLDVTDSKNFKKWSIELGAGLSIERAVNTPRDINIYNWSASNPSRYWNPNVNIGARYMFNNLFGLKLNAGLINLYNKKNAQLKYDTKLWQGSFEGVINLGRLVHMEEFSKRFNFLLHTGLGVDFNFSNKDPNSQKTRQDKTVYLVGGLTTQYLLTNSIALQFDLNMQKHYMKQITAEGVHIGANKGFEDLVGSATLGLAIYLGGVNKRDKPHADWYYIKREAVPPAYVPTTPAELLVDTDGDGIPDYLDLCPDEPGLQELHGCPDRDGDGIADFRDRCPDVPGTKEFFGCPDELGILPLTALKANMAQDVDAIVFFDINKNIIKLADYHTLYKFVYFVKEKQPDARILVEGHTDITASEAYNLKLSQRRADAVKKFLVKEGISEDQIATEAHGKAKPRATNSTVAGRRENRRAELKIAE